jgi:putative flippase GtrA
MSPVLLKLFGRFRRLGIVAVISFILNVALTVFLTETIGISPEYSFGIVLGLIFLINFFSTRYWVFKDRVNASNGWSQFVKCIAVSMTFRLLEWVAFYLLLERLHLHYVVAMIGVLCISFMTKALIYDRYVFR